MRVKRGITAVLTAIITVFMLASCTDGGFGNITISDRGADRTPDSTYSVTPSPVTNVTPKPAPLQIDFKQVADENGLGGEHMVILQDDFDGDGIDEAFAIDGQPSDWDEDMMEALRVWFIDSRGIVTDVDAPLGMGWQPATVTVPNGKFVVVETTFGGSSSISHVYGCRDGNAFIPQISGISGGFGMSEDGRYVYYANDFSEGFHDYVETEVFYNPDTREFYR